MPSVTKSGDPGFGWVAELWPSVNHREEANAAVDALVQSAAGAPGLTGIAISEAETQDQIQYVVIRLSFDSAASQDAWDQEAESLLDAASELWNRRPEIQRDAGGAASEVTEVVSTTIDPQYLEQYRGLRRDIAREVVQFPGFVSISSEPLVDDASEWITELTFVDQDSLDAWQRSDQRQHLVSQLEGMTQDDVRLVPTGFGRWVSTSDPGLATTPTWKSAMVVVAVLYAMVSVLDITLGDSLGSGWSIGSWNEQGLGLPMPVVVFVGNAVGTVILTWVLMPLATRLMKWFLDPGASPQATRSGVIVLSLVYVIEVLIFLSIYTNLGV